MNKYLIGFVVALLAVIAISIIYNMTKPKTLLVPIGVPPNEVQLSTMKALQESIKNDILLLITQIDEVSKLITELEQTINENSQQIVKDMINQLYLEKAFLNGLLTSARTQELDVAKVISESSFINSVVESMTNNPEKTLEKSQIEKNASKQINGATLTREEIAKTGRVDLKMPDELLKDLEKKSIENKEKRMNELDIDTPRGREIKAKVHENIALRKSERRITIKGKNVAIEDEKRKNYPNREKALALAKEHAKTKVAISIKPSTDATLVRKNETVSIKLRSNDVKLRNEAIKNTKDAAKNNKETARSKKVIAQEKRIRAKGLPDTSSERAKLLFEAEAEEIDASYYDKLADNQEDFAKKSEKEISNPAEIKQPSLLPDEAIAAVLSKADNITDVVLQSEESMNNILLLASGIKGINAL
jgi:hypothetical protein